MTGLGTSRCCLLTLLVVLLPPLLLLVPLAKQLPSALARNRPVGTDATVSPQTTATALQPAKETKSSSEAPVRKLKFGKGNVRED
jgi:hypothetical protein